MKKRFAIIGLGHFGSHLCVHLTNLGADVLAIDNQERNVERLRDKVSHAVIADAKDLAALQSLGLQDMDACVVGIGEDFEASLLATANLQELKVKRIVNRIVSPVHERLLKLMGVEELILPEGEAAAELANRMIRKGVLEYFELTEDYSIVEVKVPSVFVGRTLGETNLRQNYNVNLVTVIKRQDRPGIWSLTKTESKLDVLGVPDGSYKFSAEDILVVFGSEKSLEKLLSL